MKMYRRIISVFSCYSLAARVLSLFIGSLQLAELLSEIGLRDPRAKAKFS